MDRTALLALFASLIMAGGVATAVVRSGDDTVDPVVATSESASEDDVAAPAGSDDANPAPDATTPAPAPDPTTPAPAPDATTPEPAPDATTAAPAPDATETAAPAPTEDASDQAVAIDEMPNTGGGLPALLGAGVAIGAAVAGRRGRRA